MVGVQTVRGSSIEIFVIFALENEFGVIEPQVIVFPSKGLIVLIDLEILVEKKSDIDLYMPCRMRYSYYTGSRMLDRTMASSTRIATGSLTSLSFVC